MDRRGFHTGEGLFMYLNMEYVKNISLPDLPTLKKSKSGKSTLKIRRQGKKSGGTKGANIMITMYICFISVH